MVRYQGRAAMARLTVPFAREKPFEFPSQNVVDQEGGRQVARAGAGPFVRSARTAEFLRRAMLDAIGTTPSPDEVEDFIADPDSGQASQAGRPDPRSARNTSITGRSSGATCCASIPKSWAPRECSRSTSGFARPFGPTCTSTGWSKSS